MMDVLFSFEHNGYLFKCAHDEFDIKIKDVLTDILIHKLRFTKDMQQYKDYGMRPVKCIICQQCVFDDSWFVICNECCKLCIGEDILIAIIRDIYICHRLNNGSWRNIDPFALESVWKKIYNSEHYNNKNSLVKYFIDCLHQLTHRFYHTAPTLLLLSLYDPQSGCSVLNKDIVFYMF